MSEKRKAQLRQMERDIAHIRQQIEIETAKGPDISHRLQELRAQLVALFKRYLALSKSKPQTDP
jgi:hypothetical protein